MTDDFKPSGCEAWDEMMAQMYQNQPKNAPLPPQPPPQSAQKDREFFDEAAKERAAREDEFEEMYMEWLERREREITGGWG